MLTMPVPDPADRRAGLPIDWIAVVAGAAITLAVCGYQLGRSNHAVYLLEPLRQADPTLLRNDWWCSSTLQYHGVFGRFSAWLMRLGALPAAFFVIYLTLVALFHLAWWRITTLLGGGRGAYLASIAAFYLSAAGFGLGMYHVFQDSALLPSNLANVAVFWALAAWIGGRAMLGGSCLGIAGALHLNYAIAALILWPVLIGWVILGEKPRWRDLLIGSITLGALCLMSIVPALRIVLERRGALPLSEFIDLYVRIRHPHHYDPSSWHPLLWVSFLWPFPLVAWQWRGWHDHPPTRRALQLIVLLLCTQAVALIGAGIWYVSETLVQMSLWRLSIFPKLLACTMVGIMLVRMQALQRPLQRRPLPGAALLALAGVLLGLFAIRGGEGVLTRFLLDDDGDYIALTHWVRDNTPRDAIFLVPPQEQSMRLHGRRAIVINYKGVPQLSAELPEWRTRLENLLQMDLRTLPGRMDHALSALAERYRKLDVAHLAAIADRYGARYAVIEGQAANPRWHLVHARGTYRVYEIAPAGR